MEWKYEPKRARAAFNMLSLHLAGYTYHQIELFRPAQLDEDELHDLLIKKLNQLLGEREKKHPRGIELLSKVKRRDQLTKEEHANPRRKHFRNHHFQIME